MARLLVRVLGGLVLLAGGLYVAWIVSPWPSALVIRWSFAQGGEAMNEALASRVPAGVVSVLDVAYAPGDADALLDIHMPADAAARGPLPAVIWIHGGAWVAGDKSELANYLRILASHGYIAVAVNYSRAPAATYPTPVLQANAALAFATENAAAYHIDPERIVLAGDSAGSQIAAQLAGTIVSPDYARLTGLAPAVRPAVIRGTVLFCGAYDVGAVNLDGSFGWFLKSVLWSYSGVKDFKSASGFEGASVINYATADFPPSYISAGNADPLGPQSVAFAAKLRSLGVAVETLFFAADHSPPLEHEYQFVLGNAAGEAALAGMLAFLAERTR